MHLKKNEGYTFFIVGLARNVSQSLLRDLRRIEDSFGHHTIMGWHIIESDSKDSTVEVLQNRCLEQSNFSFYSAGNLRLIIKERTERIAYCRNLYLDYIKENKISDLVDYIVVVDFDGINNCLSQNSIAHCFEDLNWDALFPYQNNYYYDVYALRHKYWAPNDPFAQENFLVGAGISPYIARYFSLVLRKRIKPNNSKRLKVDSAFGGIGIYRSHCFRILVRYSGMTDSGEQVCEHVNFHRQLNDSGMNLYIDFDFINSTVKGNSYFFDYIKILVLTFMSCIVPKRWVDFLICTIRNIKFN
jgi:hypothetical protein